MTSEPPVLRPATAADLPGITAVAAAACALYLPRMDRPPAPMTADYAAAVRRGEIWVAVRGRAILGLAALLPGDGYLLLDNVAVAPAEQGRGVGARLLALAQEQAIGLGLAEIRLYTNEVMTENLGYYARRGYRETHRAEQDGYRRVFFAKSLPGPPGSG